MEQRNTNRGEDELETTAKSPETGNFSLEEVYRRYAPLVARYAARLAGPRLDHEDIVHDVFLVVERRLHEFRGDARLSTWLFRITMNVVRSHLRRQQRRSLLPGRLQAKSEPPPAPFTPADVLESRHAVELCYEILDKLPDKQRTALILFELEGQSGEEIARAMDAPVDTVWVWLSRARKTFLKHLKRTRLTGVA